MPYKNKEDQQAWAKRYREANKEELDVYYKNWSEDKKEELSAKNKAWKDSHKDGLYTVYLLAKEDYVGHTENLYSRLNNHKSKGKDVSDVKILGKYHTKDEAKRVEASYHDNGFKGAYGFKQRMEEFNKPEAVARRKEIENYLRQVGIDFNLI